MRDVGHGVEPMPLFQILAPMLPFGNLYFYGWIVAVSRLSAGQFPECGHGYGPAQAGPKFSSQKR